MVEVIRVDDMVALGRRSYSEIDEALRNEPDDRLISLLDDRSIKIGDSAAYLLERRNRLDLVVQHALQNRLRTRHGKFRAQFILGQRGKAHPQSLSVFLMYLNDRNPEVAENALFYLVLWNDKSLIPAIRSCQHKALSPRIETAIAALEASDYRIFTPYFKINRDVWPE